MHVCRPIRWCLVVATVALAVQPLALAQSVALHSAVHQGPTAKSAVPAPRIVEIFGVAPLTVLRPTAEAESERVAAVRTWNAQRRQPYQDGLVRTLPQTVTVPLAAGLLNRGAVPWAGGMVAPTTFDRLAWGGAVQAVGAYRLRLHLAAVHLPPGSRFWVHSGAEEKSFGLELRDEQGGLWTPSVAGDQVALDVEVPAGTRAAAQPPSFGIDAVAEIFPKDNTTTGPCDTDVACAPAGQFPDLEAALHAIASITFIDQGSVFLCSGGLLNDSRSDETPYFLTANHCISNASAASSVEAFWDFYRTVCGGSPPDLGSVPTSQGSTLLATGDANTASDYALLRLSSVPPGRTFLGWDAGSNAAPDGALLFRVSSPGQEPFDYCVTQSNSSVPACGGPRRDFLYSSFVLGGTFGGSSGAPAMLANGQVVGQLYGGCNNADDCSPLQYTIDGGFYASFPNLQPWLLPQANGHCRANATTLCVQHSRFSVTVSWSNQYDGSSGIGHAVPSTDSSGFFYFTDPSNDELIVKMLDFGTVFKFFYGQLTDLQFSITVTDNATGNTKQYQNTPGNCGGIDESAFSKRLASPTVAPSAARCFADARTLCLLGGTLAVRVAWQNQFNGTSGTGMAFRLSDESGRFTFTDPSDTELVLKALDFGGLIKFYYGTLSDLGYEITVTDLLTGAVKTYTNPPGNYCGGIDNNAF